MTRKRAAACLLIDALIDDDDDAKKTRGPTRKWVKRRETDGLYARLIQELLVEDSKTYREMMRMNYECFKSILNIIEPYISPQESSKGTKVIRAPERLALTIRFLATGETFRDLHLQFRIGERAISYIVKQVTETETR